MAAEHQLIEADARLGSVAHLQIANAVLEFSDAEPTPVCVGDIILITAPIEFQVNSSPAQKQDLRRSQVMLQRTTICLEAEGVADIQVHVSQVTVPLPGLHRSLFTIMGCLYQHDAKEMYTKKTEKEYATRTEGEAVQFGDEIQLQHVNSGNYLSFSSLPWDRGFQITLGERLGRATWLKVVGGAKGTKVGQPVYYHNRVVLQAKCDLVEYYMHLYGYDNPPRFEVASYSEPFSWTFSKFQSPLPKETSISLLKPIIFRHKDLRLPLTHSKDQFEEWKVVPSSLTLQNLSNSQMDVDPGNEEAEFEGLGLSNAPDDGMCYWRLELPTQVVKADGRKREIELPQSFTTQNIGGAVESKKQYLLRNVQTNQYLGNNLKLLQSSAVSKAYAPSDTSLAPDNCALVQLITAKVDTKSLVHGIDAILRIEDAHLEAEINEVTGKNVHHMIPTGADSALKGTAEIILSDSSSEQAKYTFEVLNVPKTLCKFVEITVELVPQLRLFFNYLANYGFLDGTITYFAALSQLKEFRRMRDIALRAMDYLTRELIHSTTKEMLEKRQHFIISCSIHTLLIDIARMLLQRSGLADDKQGLSLEPGRPREVEALLRAETGQLVSEITNLLYYVAFENVVACLDLSKSYKEICSLFPLSQKFVAHLLAETYRLIDPPIHNYQSYFTEWLERLETVSSDNVDEQAVFLRLVRHLSEENNSVNPISQMQLVEQLLQGSNSFKMVKVEIRENEAFIYFFTKRKVTQADFLAQNRELAELRTNIEGQTYFPLAQLTGDLSKYAVYVAEAIMLLTTMCKDSQTIALTCIQEELNLTPARLLTLSAHFDVPITVRRSFVVLASTVTLNCTALHVSQTKGETSFPMQVEEEHKGNRDAEELGKWCYNCWVGITPMMVAGVTSREALDYIQAILLLTIALVDSKIVTPEYSQGLAQSVEWLLIGLIHPGQSYRMGPKWEQLWELINAKEDSLDMLYRRKRTTDLTIQLIRLILHVNFQTKVEKLLEYYRANKDEPHPFSFSNDRTVVQIQGILEASGDLFTTIEEAPISCSSTKAVVPEFVEKPKLIRFLGECLISSLKLTREVRNMVFELTKDIVTANDRVGKQIEAMQLLDSPKFQKYAMQMQALSRRLQFKRTETILRIEFSSRDPQKADEVRFDLEKLLSVLCRRGKTAEEFTAVQNIARDLLLHTELIKLWEILQDSLGQKQLSSQVMAKSLERALNSTVYCLYYFALDSDANRSELLKLLRPSFFTLTVPILPFLIQQLTDFEHVSQYQVSQCYKSVLLKCTFENRSMLAGLEWLRASIRRRDLGRHKDLQNLGAMAIIAHFQARKVSLLSPSDAETMSAMISLLAETADDNPAARAQCRHLVTPYVLRECLKAATSASIISAWVHFLQTVYYDLQLEELAECLSYLLPWLARFRPNQAGSAHSGNGQIGTVLVNLCRDGFLDQAYSRSQPEKVDLKDKATIYENSMAELWQMLSSGDQWMYKTGLCHSLPRLLLKITQSNQPITDSLRDISNILQQEFLQIHQVLFRVDKNYDQLDLSLLKSSVFACFKAFALFVRNELNEHFFDRTILNETNEEEIPQIIMPISLAAKQIPSSEPLPNTDSNSLAETRNVLWKEFVRVVKQVCDTYTMSPKAAISDAFLHIPLIQKLATATLTTKERAEVGQAFKSLIKKIDPQYHIVVFKILDVIIEECKVGSKANPMAMETLKDSGALVCAIEIVMKRDNLFTVDAALQFLLKALRGQRTEMQNWLISQLLETEAYLSIFQLLSLEFTASLDRIYSQSGDYLVPSERKLVAPYFSFGCSPLALRDINQKVLTQLIDLIEICCDNCNSRSQLFMRAQNKSEDDPLALERDSVNMVSVVANYFVKLCQGGLEGSGEILIMVNASLEAMTEFVTGPCEENQTDLGTDVQLISSLNSLIQFSHKRRDSNAWVDVMKDALTILHTFLEGGNNVAVADSLIRYLDIPFLLNALKEIYDFRIERHTAEILLEVNIQNPLIRDNEHSSDIIDVGFSIMMLLLKLQKFFPAHPDLAILTPNRPDSDILGLKLSVLSHLPTDYIAFYSSLIGYVEITRNGVVEGEFFKIPYKCKFLTMNTKTKSIIQAMDLSHHQKIQNFMQLTLMYRREMEHQQMLYSYTWVKDISQAWKIYGWISFICIVIINITLLVGAGFDEVSYVDSTERQRPINLFTICMGIIQLIFSLISFLCYLAEYFPNISERIGLHKEDALEFPEYASIWHNDSVLMKAYHKTEASESLSPIRSDKVLNIFMNADTIYHVFFLLVSAAAIPVPALYAALLLDVFKRSDELVNIVRAVTQNRKQLILTIIMGIIVVYMFSMVSIVGFNKYFPGDDPEVSSMYCDSLWDCFFSIVHMATRAGGGLGDGLDPVSKSDNLYYPRILLDLLFFAIVILIVQNIIFGIIVDTFGELRDKREELLEELNTQCYVCGVSRKVLERSGKGWVYHFLNEHSLFAYMAFITYVVEKDEGQCTGLEKYVKDKIAQHDASFFPTTSKLLQDRNVDLQDDEKDDD